MIKKLSSIFIVCGIFCCIVGCSAVSKDHYYSPAASNGILKRKCNVLDPIYCSGPADHVVLTSNDISIEVSVKNVDRTAMSFGPLIFPVIPVFLLDWFATEKEPPKQIGIQVEFVKVPDTVNTAVIEYKIKSVLEKLTLTTGNGSKFIPSKSGFHWESLMLIYDVDTTDLNSFELHLDGIVFAKKKLSFPAIKFKKASGWVWEAVH